MMHEDMNDQQGWKPARSEGLAEYEIPEINLDKFEEAIVKLNKRAKKLKMPEVSTTVIRPSYMKKIDDDKVSCVKVILNGGTIKISGHEMIAVIDHVTGGFDQETDTNLNLVKIVPGQADRIDFTPYRHVHMSHCDHCGVQRQRNETFLLIDEKGDVTRVGRNCLKDFFGHNPHAIARYLEVLAEAREISEASEGLTFGSSIHDIATFLKVVAASIKLWGWVSKSKAMNSWDETVQATATIAFAMMQSEKEMYHFRNEIAEEEMLVEDALTWIREKDYEGLNDYMYNLYVACKSDIFSLKMSGIIASLIPAYQREMEKVETAKQTFGNSEYVGNLKERRDFDITFLGSTFIEGMYGATEIVRMTDGQNSIVWFASSKHGMEQGKSYRVKATVKKHEIYTPKGTDIGIKTTNVNRLKVVKEL